VEGPTLELGPAFERTHDGVEKSRASSRDDLLAAPPPDAVDVLLPRSL
jgi:hypothetical protein